MKPKLYRKIFKALNEDLNMILSDDDFKEPEIDLGVHIQNVLKKINIQILKKNVAGAIENNNFKELKDIIENEWDGKSKIFVATNKNIQHAVSFSIYELGKKTNLNWIDTSNVTNMRGLFSYSLFTGDISGWDVSNVTNMERMFLYSKFTGDISEWDVSNVTNMGYMFYESAFIGDISGWNVSSVKNKLNMFDDCPIKEEYKPKFND